MNGITQVQSDHPNAALLQSATKGFDFLFSNDIVSARSHFSGNDDPFHLIGLGVCAFLEAALGMEAGLMTEATRCLSLSEAGTRKHMKSPKSKSHNRFQPGLEWEIINADAVVLLGLTHALSESYMGYLQCMYSLNSAHSKFTKLYKTVFPRGLDLYLTPSATPSVSRKPSNNSFTSSNSISSSNSLTSSSSSAISAASASTVPANSLSPQRPSMFSRWLGSSSASTVHTLANSSASSLQLTPDGPVEDLIVAGTAFGYGLFNLVFSLLPKRVQSLVGFLGFKHDRKLALQALSVASTKKDVHGVFAGLVLMTYYGVVLLLSGYQADEERILRQYKAIVNNIEHRYPSGALWILNRAKIMRMSYDADGAIRVLRDGLKPERPHSFVQADMLLIFELAWTLLSQRRYKEAAEMFLRVTEINSWSHGTYYFIAAGCHFSLADIETAQRLFNAIPDMLDKKKVGGKDLPTEVFIKKKVAFYQEKHIRRGGIESESMESVKISPAEEIAIFWNTHSRINKDIAEAHIRDLSMLSPPTSIKSPLNNIIPPPIPTPLSASTSTITPQSNSSSSSLEHMDLDTVDELALRSLLLGIHYRTLGAFEVSRSFLTEAHGHHTALKVSTWISGVAMFELAVLDLHEADAGRKENDLSLHVSNLGLDTEDEGGLPSASSGGMNSKKTSDQRNMVNVWRDVLHDANAKLDIAMGLATNNIDLSSRLDSRIAMLRDEIATKREILGIIA